MTDTSHRFRELWIQTREEEEGEQLAEPRRFRCPSARRKGRELGERVGSDQRERKLDKGKDEPDLRVPERIVGS